MIDVAPPWLILAEKELGVHEIPGPQSSERVLEYLKSVSPVESLLPKLTDEIAWCGAFANWSVKESGFRGTNTWLARDWLKTGVPLEYPAYGCIVVLRRGKKSWQGHVGFFLGFVEGGYVRVLAGNQGDKVSIANFPVSDILGYRWLEKAA